LSLVVCHPWNDGFPVDLSPSSVDLDASRVDLSLSSVDLDASRVDLSLSSVDLDASRVDLSPSSVDLDASRVDLSPSSVDPDASRVGPARRTIRSGPPNGSPLVFPRPVVSERPALRRDVPASPWTAKGVVDGLGASLQKTPSFPG
jgi:hypothetical protein